MTEDFKLNFELADPDKVGEIITLINGESAEGKKQWAYLAISPLNYMAYYQAIQKGDVDISNFGKILACGEGEEPPAEVKQEMLEKHGASEDFENILAKLFVDIMSDEDK